MSADNSELTFPTLLIEVIDHSELTFSTLLIEVSQHLPHDGDVRFIHLDSVSDFAFELASGHGKIFFNRRLSVRITEPDVLAWPTCGSQILLGKLLESIIRPGTLVLLKITRFPPLDRWVPTYPFLLTQSFTICCAIYITNESCR